MTKHYFVCRMCGRTFKGINTEKNVLKNVCKQIPCLVKAGFTKDEITEIRKGYHTKYSEEKKYKGVLETAKIQKKPRRGVA